MRGGPRGFSLVESAIASAILAVLIVGGIRTLGAAAVGRRDLSERLRAGALAQYLANEIQSKAYEDPQRGPGALGLDTGDAADRPGYDDVDDYSGYSSTSITDASGASMVSSTGWRWQVQVAWVSTSAGGAVSVSGGETGRKRVTITVSRSDKPLAVLTFFRTRAWDSLTP